MTIRFTQQDAIEYARRTYADLSDDDVQIDDRPRLSKVEEDDQLKGYWVQARVWVPNPNFIDK